MRPWQELNLYELLGVEPDASPVEIRRAVARARRDLSPDSVALYSVLDEGERPRLTARFEEAARVLTDPVARETYDLELGLEPGRRGGGAPLHDATAGTGPAPPVLEEATVVTGEVLRQAREARNLTLGELSMVTKIRSVMLEAVEAGDLQQLPEPVYLRGFVMTYARELGIDPERAWRDYRSSLGV